MKKSIYIFLSLILLFISTSCSNNKNEDKLKEIKQKGVITLAVSPDYPPYEFYTSENGKVKVVGADIYLAEEIAKKLGVKLEIVQISFDSLLPALTSDRVDMVISGMNPSEERRKAVDFSDVYYISGSAFIIKKGTEDINSLEDLSNKKIGVQKGSIQEKYLMDELKIKTSQIQALSDVPSVLQDLENQNVDVVFLAEDVSQISLSKNKNLEISNFKLEKDAEADGMAIAFKKGNNKTLLKEINEVIEKIVKENEFEKQLNKYAVLVSE